MLKEQYVELKKEALLDALTGVTEDLSSYTVRKELIKARLLDDVYNALGEAKTDELFDMTTTAATSDDEDTRELMYSRIDEMAFDGLRQVMPQVDDITSMEAWEGEHFVKLVLAQLMLNK